jgi:chaperone modulatory protein CbpM
MSDALARPLALDLESFARLARLHPQLVGRLVALGLLEPRRDASGQLWFPYTDLAAVARLQRLRAAFSLNYAALGVVLELLDRVSAPEAASPNHSRSPGGQPWT